MRGNPKAEWTEQACKKPRLSHLAADRIEGRLFGPGEAGWNQIGEVESREGDNEAHGRRLWYSGTGFFPADRDAKGKRRAF